MFGIDYSHVTILLHQRGEVNNSVAARKRIPNAENAVRPRRTLGLAKIVVALPIIEIKNEYHDADVIACTHERRNIPQPRLKLLGTNWGIKATAKTAALTFVKLVNRPRRNAGPKPILADPS